MNNDDIRAIQTVLSTDTTAVYTLANGEWTGRTFTSHADVVTAVEAAKNADGFAIITSNSNFVSINR